MKSSEIVNQIENRVHHYPSWTVGITNDPERRRRDLNRLVWYQWKTDSEEIAREVKKHFIDKGMDDDLDGSDSPNYVYVFI
jgi:hypothetical protein